MKLKYLILIGIVIIAAFLRFNNLSSVPPSASLDEASIGWNAYSILNTGKDEYGKAFPLLLRAYDDWRPALYVYFVIPFVKVFGLNILAVRLPSVIFSLLTVLATYFLTKELFKNQRVFSAEKIALVCTFLLAISPWHIYISRLGHEVNLGLSFAVFAVLFFLKRNIYLSSFFFLLSFISYQTEKAFIPVLILGIFFIFRKEVLEYKKKILIAFIFSLIILIPFARETFSKNGLIRFTATNVFEYNKTRFDTQAQDLERSVESKNILAKIIYNRRILDLQILSEGYLSHFNPVWLFTNSYQDRHKVPNLGLLYLWELPFIVFGIYVLAKYKFDKNIKKLIFLWFLSAPLAASLATDAPQALRSITFLPTWQIFSSLGIVYMYLNLKRKKLFRVYLSLFSIIIIFSIVYLFEQYFYIFPKYQSNSFQYALSQTIPYVLKNQKNYNKIIFANDNNLTQSYMFFLFYSKYDPKLYLKQGGSVSGGYAQTHKFGKYEFRPIDILKEEPGNLYITNYQELNLKRKLANQVKALKIISNLDGEKAIKIVTK